MCDHYTPSPVSVRPNEERMVVDGVTEQGMYVCLLAYCNQASVEEDKRWNIYLFIVSYNVLYGSCKIRVVTVMVVGVFLKYKT